MFKLRDYQIDIIDRVRAHMVSGVKKILVCAPTGSGKTVLTASMLGSAASKNMNSVFNVHRRELVKQSMLAFDKSGVEFGIIAAGFQENLNPLIQIASVQSLSRRLHKIPEPKLVIWDECHHIAAGSWNKIFNLWPNAFHIGLTATPQRLDGKGLKNWFDVMVKGPSVPWLIENGSLSKYKMYAPTNIDMSAVKSQMGDYKKSDVEKTMMGNTITGSAIREYKRHCNGKRAVVFCASIKHSEDVVRQFIEAGVSAMHVDGETNRDIRDFAIQEFSAGKIKVLSNVDLFGEGFDLPSIEASILLRPTQSLGLYLQQVGRALRPSPGKEYAVILDHVGNVDRHGLPDEEREWSLEDRPKKAKGESDKGSRVRTCNNCYAALPPEVTVCKYCGFEFEIESREIKEVEGDLVEVDKDAIKKQRKVEQAKADTLADLIELGKKRGYKRPEGWAKHIFNARQSKKIGR